MAGSFTAVPWPARMGSSRYLLPVAAQGAGRSGKLAILGIPTLHINPHHSPHLHAQFLNPIYVGIRSFHGACAAALFKIHSDIWVSFTNRSDIIKDREVESAALMSMNKHNRAWSPA